jgi:small-conductance mechanosensitive channel
MNDFLKWWRAVTIDDLIFKTKFYHNSLIEWGLWLGLVTLLYTILKYLLHGRLSSYLSARLSFVRELINKTYSWVALALALRIATLVLHLDGPIYIFTERLLIVALIFQAAVWLGDIVAIFIRRAFTGKRGDSSSTAMVGLIITISQFAIWIIGLLTTLDSFGVNITALIAGLGIGGVAVALAVQNILGDFLSSISIVLDKPFEVGDFIIVNDVQGTVEQVGLKTTRIRSLSGEELIVPNSDLLSGRIRNFKRMQERRVAFKFGISYETSSEQLKEISDLIKTIIEKQSPVRFERAHFSNLGESSLDYEAVYWVLNSDYNNFMNIHQSILLELKTSIESMKVAFAYPTRVLQGTLIQKTEQN